MLTIGSTLTLFSMLGISSLAVFWAKKLNVPHTVLLVCIGIVLGLLAFFPHFSFLGEFTLTPELLFYLLLPTLIFESAYNMDIRKLVKDSKIILLLAIGSFLISTLIITFALQFILTLIGFTVPLSITLLFGALISATDPVAVLALFKEYGVPKRLSLIFEGESLFNDATAVALFLIILEGIRVNDITFLTSIEGFISFVIMLVGGVIFGLFVGGVFAWLVGLTRESEVASITLTVVLAHVTFILAEVISQITIGDFQTHISPIIATTVASLLMGNYGRVRLNQKIEGFVNELWEQFAFMANSLIFILIGLLIVDSLHFEIEYLIVAPISIVVVAIARALSIYPITFIYNRTEKEINRIKRSWQHLLAWGSLRGALAITMVLLIPEELTVPGWTLDTSPRDFILLLTVSTISATIFVKATTIKHFINTFKLSALSEIEELEYQGARALMHHQVTERLTKYTERGYISNTIAKTLLDEHDTAFKHACSKISELSEERRNDLAFRVLRIFAIGIERRHLKNLYTHQEITESVYRRISGKLKLQLESIESGNLAPDTSIHADASDVFERLVSLMQKIIFNKTSYTFAERYMYYRAQTIISRKVLTEIERIEQASTIFTNDAVEHVQNLYQNFKENSERKLQAISEQYSDQAMQLAKNLAEHSVDTIEENVLDDIYKKELVTQKLFITLSEEISSRQY